MDPVKRDLQQAEQQAWIFMVTTYALLALIIPVLLLLLFLACRSRKRGDEKQETSDTGKCYTSELKYFIKAPSLYKVSVNDSVKQQSYTLELGSWLFRICQQFIMSIGFIFQHEHNRKQKLQPWLRKFLSF